MGMNLRYSPLEYDAKAGAFDFGKGDVTLGSSGSDTVTFTAKLGSQIYHNLSDTTYQVLKIHNHDTTSSIGGAEFKGDLINAATAVYGIYNDWAYEPTGLTGTAVNVTAQINVMRITAGYTITAGSLYGTESHVQLLGTLNGSQVNAIGVNGVLSGAGANTTVLNMACVAGSMSTGLVNPTTGTLSYYLANSLSTVVVDNLICMYGASQYTTNFVSFNAAATDKCVEVNSGTPTGAISHIIRVLIGGTAGYIPVYAGKPS